MGVLFSQEACEACSRFAEATSEALAQFGATATPADSTTPTYDVETLGYQPED